MSTTPIRTALISVSNKEGLVPFITELKTLLPDLQLIASGGTGKTLVEAECDVTDLSAYTNSPECFGGRVKTLHPKIAGGILYRRGVDDEQADLLGIPPIDLVVCNLYNFAAAAAEQADLESLTEEIDIGGLTLIRAAAKNFTAVTVVTDPADYEIVLQQVRHTGAIDEQTRQHLAAKAFMLSADYEALVSTVMTKRLTGEEIRRPKLTKGIKLRYGENPDQEGWAYQLEGGAGIAQANVLSGKQLSYNNYEDTTAAYRAAKELHDLGMKNGVAVIKHGNLCGYATAPSLEQAFELAWEGDSKSAFGSVIAMTAAADETLIPRLQKRFIEVLVAPGYSEELLQWLKEKKPNVRVLQASYEGEEELLLKSISGGLLVQTAKKAHTIEGKVVTETPPTTAQKALIPFAVAAVKFSKSNAIALVRQTDSETFQLIGAGAGQPNRIDSLQRLAVPKAREHAEDLSSCVMASDGFFPFADSVEYAASQGITCCVQPGGSMRDSEVIDKANELQVSMVFTGERYFTH